MGNSASATVQNGMALSKKENRRLYTLVDMHASGQLMSSFRRAESLGNSSELASCIKEKVENFMYNHGKGKMEAIAELVKLRNMERNSLLSALYRKKGKGKSGPNILDDFKQEGVVQYDLKKVLKLLDGGGKGGRFESKYREIVWRLEERGSMGENLVGVCLLQGTSMHNKLAMKLIQCYPKLVNDVFISEEYYGLSPLHQAIVNEDPQMVNFLLQYGADVNQRCYGAFFCCDDQKSSRTDSLEHEYVDVTPKTSYTGHMYFGEYPLAFAACTNQFDCYRLLRQKKADPNLKDTNGNTVLHLTVIHEKPEMLKFAYDTGAKLQITNNQNLTPLTLAAKLAKKQMFEQLLNLEAETIWVYGDASSTAYPLAKIDTISEETGAHNEDSALSYVVYGLRLGSEIVVIVLVLYQIVDEGLDIYRIGQHRWWQTLKSFPAKILYKIALLLILFSVPMRLLCGVSQNMLVAENFTVIVSVVFTTVHFLYYSRALKFVGPFVLMVYQIVLQDMIRFVIIYAIFLMGFSQAFFLIFLACERERKLKKMPQLNILSHPSESLLRLFVMTIGEFTVLYRELNACQKEAYLMAIIGKGMFVVFELFVSIMQLNMLIAMMTRTYEMIFRTQKEWKRQWAQVILMLELSLKPEDRMMAMLRYSRPMGTNKVRRAFMVSKKINANELSESDRRLRELQSEKFREEKRQLLKKRLKDFTLATAKNSGNTSMRPGSSFFLSTPLPQRRNL